MRFIAALSLGLLLIFLVGCTKDHYPTPYDDSNTVTVRVDNMTIMTFENVVSVQEDGSTIRVRQMVDGKTALRAIFYIKDNTTWDFKETPIISRVSPKPKVEAKKTTDVDSPKEG